MSTSPGTVITFTPSRHTHLIPYLAALHAACITHDRTIATFLPPLSHEKLLAWWKERIAEVTDRTRVIFMLLKDSDGDASSDVIRGSDVVGVVMLALPSEETRASRAGVEKLLLHTSWRWRRGARMLMEALEREALGLGKAILTLDVETGSPAEEVFKKLGYKELGRIPKYSMSPTGELKGSTFCYKELD